MHRVAEHAYSQRHDWVTLNSGILASREWDLSLIEYHLPIKNKQTCWKQNLSHDMRFPTLWYVQPTTAQISLRMRAVWSEPLLIAWIFYECKATDRTSFEVSKLKRRLHTLVWDYTCQNATLLKITCRGSNVLGILTGKMDQTLWCILNSTKETTYYVLLF